MRQANPNSSLFDGARIGVVGLGKSGLAVCEALDELDGVALGLFDANEERLDLAECTAETRYAHSDNTRLADAVSDFDPDIVIPAPGIAEVDPLFAMCGARGVQMMSEIDLAWHLRALDSEGQGAPWLCVTGTNGKTTTASMTAAILSEAGLGGQALGNIGNPAVYETRRTDEDAYDAFVLEHSSFQLRTTSAMKPEASVCLNFADDHLEWHGSRQAYHDAKARIYNNVRTAGVYPLGDPSVQSMIDTADMQSGARAVGLTYGVPGVGQIGLVEDIVVDRAFVDQPDTHACELFTLDDIAHLAPTGSSLPPHILSDALAAAALARSLDIAPDVIVRALASFPAGNHRIELVAEHGGVRYIDDSKATNAHAAQASLNAQEDKSVIWIVGGLAKGARFTELVASIRHKLAGVVVIGTDQSPWREALAQCDDIPVRYIDPSCSEPMGEAVTQASHLAHPGQTVLLAPACASMDQFASYAERGDKFASAAKAL